MRSRLSLTLFAVALLGLVATALPCADAPEMELRILGTGEIHATPDACDCPLNPVGGLANLARVLQMERVKASDRTILIDTGAWAAGGSLDIRSAGAVNDRERSRLMLEFLNACKYNAIALGDEELALGRSFFAEYVKHEKSVVDAQPRMRLPFTCANLMVKAGERIDLNIASYINLTTIAGGYWVVGLAPPGEYGTGDDGFKVSDPEPVLRDLIAKAAADPAHPRIILASHLGDAATDALLTALVKKPVLDASGKPIDLGIIVAVLAGHRRPAEVRQSIANTPVMFVRGEGQYVSVIEFPKGGGFPRLSEIPVTTQPVPARWDRVENIPRQIRALIATARPQIDITMATDCPHCVTALEPVLKMLARLEGPPIHRMAPPVPLAEVRLRFMIHKSADGRWITGIQPGLAAETKSYEETRRLLIVQKYAPEAVWALLRWRKNNPAADFTDGLKQIDFPAWRLQGALEAHEDEPLLEENRVLTEQRKIPGTPSVYIQNRHYDGSLQEGPLMSAICALLRARTAGDAEAVAAALAQPCAGIPRCYQDGECTKPGFIARCLDAGKPTAECKFIEDKEVTVWVVQDPQAVHSNASELVGQLGKFFAKMKVEAVDANSDLGKKIIAETKAATLPVYAVKNLPDAVNQADVEKFGRYADAPGGLFVLDPLPWYSHQHIQRARAPGALDVFYEVHSPNAAKALLRLTATLEMLKKQHPGSPVPSITLHPLVYLQPADAERLQPEKLMARGGLGELEQSARLLAVAAVLARNPAQILAYAQRCAETPGSTYWERPLKALALDPEAIATQAAGNAVTVALRDEAKLAESLRIQGDIAFLVRNQELVPIQNGERMYQVLERLQQDLAVAVPEKAVAP